MSTLESMGPEPVRKERDAANDNFIPWESSTPNPEAQVREMFAQAREKLELNQVGVAAFLHGSAYDRMKSLEVQNLLSEEAIEELQHEAEALYRKLNPDDGGI